jgi:hypothetical protein
MAKTPTPAEAFQSELAAFQKVEAEQHERRRRLDALQLPIMANVMDILKTRPITEAMKDLIDAANNLTDGRQGAVVSLLSQLEYATSTMVSEQQRIQAQVDEDTRTEAEAAAV